MRRALEEAHRARDAGEVPVGAVVVFEGAVVGTGFNRPIGAQDPTAHAEIVALGAAGQALGQLSPERGHALRHGRALPHVRGGHGPRAGSGRSSTASPIRRGVRFARCSTWAPLPLNHRFEVVEGVLADECREILQGFFREKRARPLD